MTFPVFLMDFEPMKLDLSAMGKNTLNCVEGIENDKGHQCT